MADSVVGRAYWELRAEDDRLRADLRSAETQIRASGKKSADAYSGEWKKGSQGVLGHLNSVKGALAGIGIGIGLSVVTDFLGGAIQSASALNETVSKTEIVFGDAAESVMAMGEDSATALGMSRNAALSAAAVYGNLFRAMGIAEETSAEMSTGLVQLAADLASFNDMDPTEVLDKLRAGLSGETEPLRTLGVNLNEARIKQEALESGLWNGIGALDAAAKAQATYALILDDTTLAQGDFDRTSGSLANQQRTLESSLTDLTAEIGTALLPVMVDLANYANDTLVPALRSVVDVLKDLGPWIEGFSIAATFDIGRIVEKFGSIPKELGELPPKVGEALSGLPGEITGPVEEGTDTAVALIRSNAARMRQAAYDNIVAYAAGLIDAQNEPRVAIDAMNLAMRTVLTREAEVQFLLGQLNGTHFAAGFADARPEVVAATTAAVVAVTDRLAYLGVPASQWGSNIGLGIAGGLWQQIPNVEDAARAMGYAISRHLRIESEPPDHTSPLYGHMKWGGNFGKDIALGLAGSRGTMRDAAHLFASSMVPTPMGPGRLRGIGGGGMVNGGGTAAAGGTTVFHFHYSPGMSTASPGEIENLRRQITGIVVDGLARSGLAERPPGRF